MDPSGSSPIRYPFFSLPRHYVEEIYDRLDLVGLREARQRGVHDMLNDTLYKEPISMCIDMPDDPSSVSPCRPPLRRARSFSDVYTKRPCGHQTSYMPQSTSLPQAFIPLSSLRTTMRPGRTYTNSSLSSETSTRSSLFSNVTRSSSGTGTSVNSSTSLPLSHSCFSASTSMSYQPVLPPYAPSPFVPYSPRNAKVVLCLDGGGIRGYFGAAFLQRLQQMLPDGIDIREVVDLIGGTSTGGILALMFGRLVLPVDRIISIYLTMPKKIFGSRRMKKAWLMFTSSQNSSEVARELYEQIVADVLGDAGAPLRAANKGEGCRPQLNTFVVALDVAKPSEPVVFSTYRSDDKDDDAGIEEKFTDPTGDISIVSAALATSAAPTYFKPVIHDGKCYADGGVGYNNPSDIALDQLARAYGPNAYADTFISLGTGIRSEKPLRRTHKKNPNGLATLLDMFGTFAHMATDSERVHKNVDKHFAGTGAYFRFNPPGMEKLQLDDWASVDVAVKASNAYLDHPETQRRMLELVDRLLRVREQRMERSL